MTRPAPTYCLNTVFVTGARLLALSNSSGLVCAWLRALLSPQLGLALLPAEFVMALHLWLGIPVFPEADPALCSCHQLVSDHFGDHLIGCSLCALDVIMPYVTLFIMLYQKTVLMFIGNRECLVNPRADRVMYFTQTFTSNGRPTYFDISVRSAGVTVTHSASS